MQIDKIYRLNPYFRKYFIGNSASNEDMLKIIEDGGGSFTVLDMYVGCRESSFVTKIRTKHGEVFDSESGGLEYFELSNDEFEFFEEVTSVDVPVTEIVNGEPGINSVTLTVTKENSQEMIELIKKMF